MDRVSNLPDELLCNVLSYLTTKEAALTSILSKRWRDLFALVPKLDLDDSVFLHPKEGKGERDEIRESFMDFVDRVLALQGDAPIHKVSLKCKTGVDSDCLDSWITNVLARGVSDLDLCIVSSDRYLLSPEGFESRKLVKVKLGQGIDLGWWADGIYLPALKTLILDSVEFCVDKFEMLLPACPALEELDMANIEGLGSDVTVSSASLKTLRIRSCIGSDTFSFDTPSLVYLGYYDHVAEDYPLANLINLSEARINLLVTEDQIEQARDAEYDLLEDEVDIFAVLVGGVIKLMTGIQNVHTLYLTPSTLEVLSLSLCCESMPVFNNLKLIGFYSGTSRWEAVPVLLEKCPHLETLSILGLLHVVTDSCGDVCDCIPRDDKGRSLESCPVKKIEIQGFIGAMREIAMIDHFMDYDPCLEEIEITVERHGPTELDVPEVTDLKEQMMKLYEKSMSYNVEVNVCESLFRKLLAQ